jgi:predicted nucleotidyltransferase
MQEEQGIGMNTAIELPVDEMVAVAKRHHVRELALFGSVLRPDFALNSDIDVLVEFEDGHPTGYSEVVGLRLALSDLIGRSIDLVEKPGLHWYIRDDVLAEAKVLYVA